jgi:hypothetical protein
MLRWDRRRSRSRWAVAPRLCAASGPDPELRGSSKRFLERPAVASRLEVADKVHFVHGSRDDGDLPSLGDNASAARLDDALIEQLSPRPLLTAS